MKLPFTKLEYEQVAEAEKCVIGAVILRGAEAMGRASLSPDQFHDPRHRSIFAACERLVAANKPIDPVTIEFELGERVEASGGLVYLSELLSLVPTADNVASYAEVVRDFDMTKRVLLATSEATERYRGDELVAKLMDGLSALMTSDLSNAGTMADMVRRRFNELADMAMRLEKGEALELGIPTGFEKLDYRLGGGLRPGIMTVVGARPGFGKSAIMRQFCDGATAAGYDAYALTLEDTWDVYVDRTLADHADVELPKFRTCTFGRLDMQRISGSTPNLLQRTNWTVDDFSGLTASEICLRLRGWLYRARRARNEKVERGKRPRPTLAVIDYVNLISPEDDRLIRRDAIDASLNAFVNLAKAENMAIVVGAQLRRDADREVRRPVLSDLKESGGLEEKAKAVVFLHHWVDADDSGRKQRRDEIILAKQNNGDPGVILAKFDKEQTRFREQ